jgi:L-asparagine transporter-like permease
MTGSGLSQIQTSDQTKLTRGLKSRHIELIAIGGAIGVGLFLGSAKAIQNGGPGLILGYAFGGLVIFFIMRALGELLLYRPVAGSFVMYADEFIGPFAGFATGWSYWFMWVVTGMAELTAIGVYVGYWLPELPQWIPVFWQFADDCSTVVVDLVVAFALRLHVSCHLLQSKRERHHPRLRAISWRMSSVVWGRMSCWTFAPGVLFPYPDPHGARAATASGH